MHKENILVIKHGSLGDWIKATGAFKLIRKYHPHSHIILLTQPYYATLAKQCGWFDEIWTDDRLPWHNIIENFKVIKQLRSIEHKHVYDLQCSNRTSTYYQLLKNKVHNWYGRAKDCSHYVAFNPQAHSIELSHDIIKASGITDLPVPDISWLKPNKLSTPLKSFGKFVLFIPGSSAKHKAKRWTASGYANVIDHLTAQGINSILTGIEMDRDIIEEIINLCQKKPLNLINQAPFEVMAELARNSLAVIGSDTGPMHIAAATGCPSLVLFSSASRPHRDAPYGEHVKVIQEDDLLNLSPDDVISAFSRHPELRSSERIS